MLKSAIALKIAARLTVVKEFPRNPEAIDAVAEDLIDLTLQCDEETAEARVRWIVETIRKTWFEWTGESDLIRLYQTRWPQPREMKSEDNEAKHYGTKPVVTCETCQDAGFIERSGVYVWCECEAGIHLHLDQPLWLEWLKRLQMSEPKPVQLAEPLQPHPAAEKIVSEEIEKTLTLNPECPACTVQAVHTHTKFWQYHCKQENPIT